ncbi:MAG: hypothetical protein NBV67_14985 [Tagaea sp.]|nr:hypothetical protein [Tagaea sp.]
MLPSENRGRYPIRLTAIFAVCAALALGGCANDPRRSPVTSASGISSDPGLATIVIGQVFVGSGAPQHECPWGIMSEWLRHRTLDDRTPPTQLQLRNFACAIPDRATPPAFTVLQVPPGDYRMFEITAYAPMRSPSSTRVQEPPPGFTTWEEATVPRFSIAAGEVVYVGNVVFIYAAPAQMRGGSTPDLARAALRALWPAGAERMIDRRMSIGRAAPRQSSHENSKGSDPRHD